MYRIYSETTDHTLFEGDEHECKKVMKAFEAYNGCHRVGMEEVMPEGFTPETIAELTESTRTAITEILCEARLSGSFGDGLEQDYVLYGVNWTGLNDYTDHELVEEYAQYHYNNDEEDLAEDGLYQKAQQELYAKKIELTLLGE